MKQSKEEVEKKVKDIQNYLLSNNMADIPMDEFWKLVNEMNGLSIIYENIGINPCGKGDYTNGYKFMK